MTSKGFEVIMLTYFAKNLYDPIIFQYASVLVISLNNYPILNKGLQNYN